MINRNITIPYDEIAAFCERHHVKRLSLFGSVLRDDFRPDSDIDVLVEFEPGTKAPLFDMGGCRWNCPNCLFGRVSDSPYAPKFADDCKMGQMFTHSPNFCATLRTNALP